MGLLVPPNPTCKIFFWLPDFVSTNFDLTSVMHLTIKFQTLFK